MANVTSKANITATRWGDDKIKRPLAAVAATYYTASLIALDDDGNAIACDDTQAGIKFDGLMADSPPITVYSTDSAGDYVVDVERPFRFSAPIASASPGDEGKPVYAATNGTVAYSTTNYNLVGWVDRVISSTEVEIHPAYLGALVHGPLAAGNGGAPYLAEGVIDVQTNANGTGADTTEDTLHTYTLPANSLSANGKALHVSAWGTTGANTHNKTLKFYWGSQSITLASAVAANNAPWAIEIDVIRSGVGAQVVLARGSFNGSALAPQLLAGTQDETTALTVKTTGTNGTATANDISETAFVIEFRA